MLGLLLLTSLFAITLCAKNSFPVGPTPIKFPIDFTPLDCPTNTHAGQNTNQCNNAIFLLNADAAPLGANGIWTVEAGQASIGNINSNNSSIQLQTNSATLRWTVSMPGCTSVSAIVVLNNKTVRANAGMNQNNCNNNQFVLNAELPESGIGVWTVLSGNATLFDSSLANSAISLASKTAKLKWTVTDGGCSDNASITLFNRTVHVAQAGVDQVVRCTANPIALAANTPTSCETGAWSIISGSATIQNTSSPTTAINITNGTAVLEWTLSNGNCKTADRITISTNPVYKIVVLGSSTSYGYGAYPMDSSWVNKLNAYFKVRNAQSEVINLSVPGYNSYHVLCPTGFANPGNRPAPDTLKNITAALKYQPDAIIINLPSNDIYCGYSLQEMKDNFERTMTIANAANVKVWVATSQPRNTFTTAQTNLLLAQRDWTLSRFGDYAVDFWTTIANTANQIDAAYNVDNIHVNNEGHHIFYTRVIEKNIQAALCTPITARLPIANAGKDLMLDAPGYVQFNGSKSKKEFGEIVTYQWRQIQGKPVVIQNESAAITGAFLPVGFYSFELTVVDEEGKIARDLIVVQVAQPTSTSAYGNNSETNTGIYNWLATPSFSGKTVLPPVEKNVGSLQALPNPSNGNFTLRTNYSFSGKALVAVKNAQGQTLHLQQYQFVNGITAAKLSGKLLPGVYWVQISTAKDRITQQIIIK
ncbi:MAG: hypothetical protein RLY16_1837 [Bacteroidota bacterium]